jgi:hypothetical protein
MQVPLQVFAPATVAADGSATASIGPTAANEQWVAGYRVAVHCSTAVSEATCRVYCGGNSPVFFTDATTWGSTGDSTDNTPNLQSGQLVVGVWAGADPGAEAYLTITGTKVL